VSPEELKQYLAAMNEAHVMSAKLVLPGGVELAVTFGLSFEPTQPNVPVAPGGWKGGPDQGGVSDPLDPDPLGLGPLDAEMAFDDPQEIPE
jgi:hypothetical protein